MSHHSALSGDCADWWYCRVPGTSSRESGLGGEAGGRAGRTGSGRCRRGVAGPAWGTGRPARPAGGAALVCVAVGHRGGRGGVRCPLLDRDRGVRPRVDRRAARQAGGAAEPPYTGRDTPPDEATIRRALQRVDAQALDRLVGGWLAARQPPADADGTATDEGAVAVDGKTLRGAVDTGGRRVHLLAALDQQQGTVLAQPRVGGRATRSPGFGRCWRRWTWPGGWSPPMRCTASVTTPATWSPSGTRTTCWWPRRTSRGWWRRSASSPSGRFPPPRVTVDRGHGRLERRTVRVAPCPSRPASPTPSRCWWPTGM
jgi:hypothetical protein